MPLALIVSGCSWRVGGMSRLFLRHVMAAAVVLGLGAGMALAQPAPRAAQDAPPADAALSPDGLRAAWATPDHRAILSSTRVSASAPWGASNRLLSTRGLVHKIVFSPDGKSIAYENQRAWKDTGTPDDTWQFICVYDIATNRISYVDPSFDMDSDPVWSGNEVSFTRKVTGLPDKHLTRPVTRLRMGDWTPPPRRADERFTMASIIAAPFIYPIAPSPDGTAIAYVTREAKDRNVYLMKAGQPARRIAHYPGDDGIDLSEPPVLSRSGAAIAWMRGSRLNHQGEQANPNSFPDLPQQQVWLRAAQNDSPHLVGAGSQVMFTPDDRYLLWEAGGKTMGAALGWEKGKLVSIGAPQEFFSGARRGLRFSPDGGKVAYENRGRIEVYDLAARTTVVLPQETGQIDRGPVWSPDGMRLIFRREAADTPGLNRDKRDPCGSRRYCKPLEVDTPWSIWEADLTGGAPRRIWQAHAGVGSVFYALDQSLSPGTEDAQLLWTKSGEILFPWEGDGWRHLYAVPVSGGEARLLTPGDGEVETATLTLDRTRVIYATNIGEIGRRHLFTVGTDGGAPVAVTGGEDSQWSPAALADGRIAYIAAGWNTPPTVRMRGADGKVATAAFPKTPANFPAALLSKPKLVEFPATDGKTVFAQLFEPKKSTGCAVVFSHGGMRRQMLPGFHYMDAYQYLYEMNQYLAASRGCVAMSVDYRSGIMHGLEFRNAVDYGLGGNSELRDFVAAANYLKARKDVDAARGVGIYGLSWGGYMTAELLAQHSDIFSVGFDMAGVHVAGDPEGEKYSAYGHLDSWTSPVFLAQGDDDMNVDINDGIILGRALQVRRPQVEFKQQVLPGQTHDLYLTYEQLVGIYSDGSDWLISHLTGPRRDQASR